MRSSLDVNGDVFEVDQQLSILLGRLESESEVLATGTWTHFGLADADCCYFIRGVEEYDRLLGIDEDILDLDLDGSLLNACLQRAGRTKLHQHTIAFRSTHPVPTHLRRLLLALPTLQSDQTQPTALSSSSWTIPTSGPSKTQSKKWL